MTANVYIHPEEFDFQTIKVSFCPENQKLIKKILVLNSKTFLMSD